MSEFETAQLATVESALAFMLAGNATVTFASARTGARYTYKLTASDDGAVYFVKVLTGSDNESDFAYFGLINAAQRTFRHGGSKARVSLEAPSAKAFAWVWSQLTMARRMPDQLEVWHEGRCGRCNRKLTVPESIASGFGPECAGRVAFVARAA